MSDELYKMVKKRKIEKYLSIYEAVMNIVGWLCLMAIAFMGLISMLF
jgi:hypothetical protein